MEIAEVKVKRREERGLGEQEKVKVDERREKEILGRAKFDEGGDVEVKCKEVKMKVGKKDVRKLWKERG